jgi:hypothetical protein
MPQPTPVTSQPPPELPSMPDVGTALTNYLRSFSLWCRHGFAAQMKTGTALPGVLLRANDAPAGTTPLVFSLEVKTDGTIVAVPVALASTRRMA